MEFNRLQRKALLPPPFPPHSQDQRQQLQQENQKIQQQQQDAKQVFSGQKLETNEGTHTLVARDCSKPEKENPSEPPREKIQSFLLVENSGAEQDRAEYRPEKAASSHGTSFRNNYRPESSGDILPSFHHIMVPQQQITQGQYFPGPSDHFPPGVEQLHGENQRLFTQHSIRHSFFSADIPPPFRPWSPWPQLPIDNAATLFSSTKTCPRLIASPTSFLAKLEFPAREPTSGNFSK